MYQTQTFQIRDAGIAPARSYQEVAQYPMAPGYSMRFVVDLPDGSMEMFRKTCFSPYEQPKIEAFDVTPREQKQDKPIESRLEALEAQIAKLMEVDPDDAE
jgi:hypothetical protein